MEIERIKEITTYGHLIRFLHSENNAYSKFILERCEKHLVNIQYDRKKHGDCEKHHIIPKHMKGPDKPFNLIVLSFEEHTRAHELLYEMYGSKSDSLALKLRAGATMGSCKNLVQQAHVENMRKNKLFRFNSDYQRELALRPKKERKPFSKTNFTKFACEMGTIWLNENGLELIIKAGECQGPAEIGKILVDHPEDWPPKHQKMRESFLKNPKAGTLYVGIIKLCSGWCDSKTNKSIFRVGPWSLKGILVDSSLPFIPLCTRAVQDHTQKKTPKNSNVKKSILFGPNDRFVWSLDGQPIVCTFGMEFDYQIVQVLNQIKSKSISRIVAIMKGKSGYGTMNNWTVKKVIETNINQTFSLSESSISEFKSQNVLDTNSFQKPTCEENSLCENPRQTVPQLFLEKLIDSGQRVGFIFTGVIYFKTTEYSLLEFFCKTHKVFLRRSFKLWQSCFSQNNKVNRPPCCNSEQRGIALAGNKNECLFVNSYFPGLPETVSFTLEEQKKILSLLSSSKRKQSRTRIQRTAPLSWEGKLEFVKQHAERLNARIISIEGKTSSSKVIFFCENCQVQSLGTEMNTLGSIQRLRCCAAQQRKKGVSPAIQAKLDQLGHVIVGNPPSTSREKFKVFCKLHNSTVETTINQYRENKFGMRCCAVASKR